MGQKKIQSCTVSDSQTLMSHQITWDHVNLQILVQQVWSGAFEEADDADAVYLRTTCENQELTELWL